MMDLILWRHAEAEQGGPDMDRRLTPKGARQAARIAAWLDQRLPDTCRIIVSPARRAQQTALALERKFETKDEIAPDVAPQSVLAAAHWPDGRDTVLVVGHQPTLGRVAALLLAGEDREWSIPKGAIWWLTNRERKRGPPVAVRVVMVPDFV
jgi:phosphohistidine phosphatase